jgi:hypothetical protein
MRSQAGCKIKICDFDEKENVLMETRNEDLEMEVGQEVESEEPFEVDDSPVETTTRGDAISITPMVVGNFGGRYVRFERLEHVPAGTKTYTHPSDLGGNSKEQLEQIYAFVKGAVPKEFPDRRVALDSLWDAFSELPVVDPVTFAPEEQERQAQKSRIQLEPQQDQKRAASGPKKKPDDVYTIYAETPKMKELLEKLPPQARACAEILRACDQTTLSQADLAALIEANKAKFNSRQDSWRIFAYYRGDLLRVGFLTYA